MRPYYSDDLVTLYHGDCRDVIARMPDASVDAIITDPPYEIGFMGKQWDRSGIAFNPAVWAECLRVAKPGAHLLAFGGTKTWHRLAVAIEDAGWQIRDSIAWLYAEGYPKSKNLLKPMFEPIVMASKGVGELNVDACRIGDYHFAKVNKQRLSGMADVGKSATSIKGGWDEPVSRESSGNGRWPGNAILDGDMADRLDSEAGIRTGGAKKVHKANIDWSKTATNMGAGRDIKTYETEGDSGPASRYFPTFRFESKARADQRPVVNGVQHTTVKPLALMQWLSRLVTPAGGVVLDPFAGSGTTGEAAILESYKSILIEQEADYLPLIEHRMSRAQAPLFNLGDAS